MARPGLPGYRMGTWGGTLKPIAPLGVRALCRRMQNLPGRDDVALALHGASGVPEPDPTLTRDALLPMFSQGAIHSGRRPGKVGTGPSRRDLSERRSMGRGS